MLLVRCKDRVGETVVQADRYSWNWVKWKPTDDPDIFEELGPHDPMYEGCYQGVIVNTYKDGDENWEIHTVSPSGYGQIIIEDDNRKTRDNFRLKRFYEKEGLVSC